MATRLGIWNGALLLLGETRLATETEAREARYTIEDQYETVVKWMLERAYWNFALTREEFDSAGTAVTGFQYKFEKPPEWVKTFIVSDNLESSHPVPIRYADEGGFWHADINPIQVIYVSLDLGTDETLWPASFQYAAEAELAFRLAPKLAASRAEEMKKLSKDALRDAKSQDALDEGVKTAPPGRWIRARLGSSRSDGGNRGSLIG